MSPAGLAAGSSSTCAKRVRCITPETAVARHLVDRHHRAGQRWAGAVGASQGGAGRRPAGDMEPTAPAQCCPAPTSKRPAMKQHRAAPQRVSRTAAPGRYRAESQARWDMPVPGRTSLVVQRRTPCGNMAASRRRPVLAQRTVGARRRFSRFPPRISATPSAVNRSTRSAYAAQPTAAVSGTRRKSIGTTTVASACCIARAKQ